MRQVNKGHGGRPLLVVGELCTGQSVRIELYLEGSGHYW